MLDLTAWVDKSQPHCTCQIDLATDLDDAKNTRRFPSVQLVPGRDQVEHAGMHPTVKHTVTSEVLVVTAISRSRRDQENSNELVSTRKSVVGPLINWQPPGANDVILWGGGQLLKLNNQAIFWVDVLSVEHDFTFNAEVTP